MSDLKAYLLFPGAAKNPLYSGWMDQLSIPSEIVREYDTGWLPPTDAGILITHNHYRWEELAILRRVMSETRVPVLVLVDGILEYRNSFEHPDLADGTMFQPLHGHKLACIGASQIRWIESLGNAGKCELTGLPRLDDLTGAAEPKRTNEGPFRLLVASARTPWFNDRQRGETHRAFQAVKGFLDEHPVLNGRAVEVTWRMAEELHRNLKAPGYQRRPSPIRKTLGETHAVITTPSTLQLEAAALGLPVAVLDFHDRPQLSPMAWTIQHEEQVSDTVADLMAPPPSRQFVQDVLLADALQNVEPALPRMITLVETMVAAGIQARETNSIIQLPDRILPYPSSGFATRQESGVCAKLFPQNPVFQSFEMESLQAELSAAIHEMGEYPHKYFQQRSDNQRLRSYINWLRLLIRNRAATVEELTATLEKLRSGGGDRPVKEG